MFEGLHNQFHNQILVRLKTLRDLRRVSTAGNDVLGLAAMDCVTALFHFREHIPEADRLSRKAVSEACPDYKFIADVANTVKHGSIDREPPDGPLLLHSISDIYELGVMIEFDEAGNSYWHNEAVVCVDCTDGKRRCLDEAIVNVANYWGKTLDNLQLCDFTAIDQMPFPGTAFVSREDARSFQMGATQGLTFTYRMQFMKFGYTAGCAVPVDLSDTELKMRIWRPKHTLDIEIKNPEFDKAYVHQIELTDEQSQEFLGLNTDAEKEEFRARLIDDNKQEISEGLSEFVGQTLQIKVDR